MAVPDFQSLMLPLLTHAARRSEETSTAEAVEALADELALTDDDLKEMLPSGTQLTFVNRVGWGATYMKKARLLEPTRRGYYRITERGNALLAIRPANISVQVLQEYPEFREFQKLRVTR